MKLEAQGRDSKHGNPSGARICIGFESLTEHYSGRLPQSGDAHTEI